VERAVDLLATDFVSGPVLKIVESEEVSKQPFELIPAALPVGDGLGYEPVHSQEALLQLAEPGTTILRGCGLTLRPSTPRIRCCLFRIDQDLPGRRLALEFCEGGFSGLLVWRMPVRACHPAQSSTILR
jgi:hypothetical protein